MQTAEIEPCVEVLNAAEGHLTIQVGKDPKEHAQAKKVIEDMLKRGYAVFIEVGGTTQRVKEFHPDDEEYIIMDVPEDKPAPSPKKAKKAAKKRRVSMRKARATGIAPTAGG